MDDRAAEVARIVEQRHEAVFVSRLAEADADFGAPEFEAELARAFREQHHLTDKWEQWSEDQRWTPSAYLVGTEVGWFDGERRHVRISSDRAAATADFIHRLSAWLARREVIDPHA